MSWINRQDRFTVCGQAGGWVEASRLLRGRRPDVILTGLAFPDVDGLELIRNLKDLHPDVPVLVYSMYDESGYGTRALRAGAGGYVMKRNNPEALREALLAVVDGNFYFSDQVRRRIVSSLPGGDGDNLELTALTDRELQVFRLIGEGLAVPAIARRLGVGEKTVRAHRDNIRRKLGLSSAREVDRKASLWVYGFG